MKVKSFEEEVVYITRKLQALINAGFVIKDNIGKPIISAHQAATKLVNSASTAYTITMPDDHKCCCIKWSNMAIKLIKPYIKNKFFIEQWSSNSHYVLVDSSITEQLEQLQPIDDIKIVDTFELEFTKSTLPTYTNRASLFTVNAAPVLTTKELDKVLSLSERILVNQNNYFLLSNSITHTYNAPMTIIRILGENVISLNALNLLELILTFATNSSAVFRNKTDETISSFDHTVGAVETIGEGKNSQDLKNAINDGIRIIVTTLQKFPVIYQEVDKVKGRNFAVIVDEAHSSQTGTSAIKLKTALADTEEALTQKCQLVKHQKL